MKKITLDRTETIEVLENLALADGPPAREGAVREALTELLRPYVDEIKVDRLGNVVGIIKGTDDNGTSILMAAHMDEIAMLATVIEDTGQIRFTTLSGLDPRMVLGQQAKVLTREKGAFHGVMGALPPHLRKKEDVKKLKINDLFLDVGTSTKDETLALGISPGDFIVFEKGVRMLGKDRVMISAADARVVSLVLVFLARHLHDNRPKNTVYLAGTVQEEFGTVGAATAAYAVQPDAALALEVSIATDFPGVPEGQPKIELGKGPAIVIADWGLIVHERVLKALQDAAAEGKIPIQYEIAEGSTTDAAAIQSVRRGVMSGAVGVPTRYIHSTAEIFSLKDLEASLRLLEGFIRAL